MYALRPLSAYVLLVLMAVAIAPQEGWHACAHEGAHVELVPGHATVNEVCPICDTGLPSLLQVPEHVSVLARAYEPLPVAPAVSGLSLGSTLLEADRGPPALV